MGLSCHGSFHTATNASERIHCPWFQHDLFFWLDGPKTILSEVPERILWVVAPAGRAKFYEEASKKWLNFLEGYCVVFSPNLASECD